MVNLAKTQSIRYPWIAAGVTVGDDVSGLEKATQLQVANSALDFIGPKDSTPEFGLVEALFDDPLRVLAFHQGLRRPQNTHKFVKGKNELPPQLIVLNHVHREK